MPIGLATVPDTVLLSSSDDLHQGYQSIGRRLDVVVDDDVVELVLRSQLDAGDVESFSDLLGGFGPSAAQPDSQVVEGRRREEHQPRVRHRSVDLTRTVEVDLEEH